jgi:hypothetical protein
MWCCASLLLNMQHRWRQWSSPGVAWLWHDCLCGCM